MSLYQKNQILKKTEQDISESIIDDKPFILTKTGDDYFLPYPENLRKI